MEWADPALPPVLLTVAGRIYEPVEIRPHYAFIEAFPGEPRTVALAIRNREPSPLRIAKVESDREGIKAKLEEVRAGKEYRLVVSREPSLPVGSYRGTLEFVSQDSGQQLPKIPVTVIQKTRVYVNRGGVVFRNQRGGGNSDPAPVTVLVEKYKDPEFEVSDVRCDLPFVDVETVRLPYDHDVARYELRFTVKAQARPEASFRGTVTFKTSDKGFPSFSLPVLGAGRGASAATQPVDGRTGSASGIVKMKK